MNKKSIAIVAGLLVASSFNVLSSGGKALAVGNGGSMKCQPFRMNQVRLLPSRFQENMNRDSAWLLSAYATLYAQTGSQAVKAKADSIVNGLADVQQAYGRGGYLSAFAEGLIDRNIQGKSVWAHAVYWQK